MARPLSSDGDLDSLGSLITAAYGLDRSWVQDAACVRYRAGQRTDERNPWLAEWNVRYDDVPGREIVGAALMICHACPSQYGCARYAIEGVMKAGTWGMRLKHLKWLQEENTLDEALEIVASAEANGVAMQDCMAALDVELVQLAFAS